MMEPMIVTVRSAVDSPSNCLGQPLTATAVTYREGERCLTAAKASRQQQRIVRVSKEMSRLLRHAPPAGAMDAQGWVSLDVLAQHMRTKPSLEEIKRVVADNDKQRFVLDESHQPPRIRAAQGHSVTLSDPQLTPVTDAAAVPVAVHATSQEAWQAIQASGELRRMSRTHIHFATCPTLLRANTWAQVFLVLKLQEAMAAGHAFSLSANGGLLCEGPLPVQYVQHVAQQHLQQLWAQHMPNP